MEALQIFNNPQFGDVRVIIENEQPLFSASDVCKALGYSNPRDAVNRHVDSEDVAKHDTPTSSGIQQLTYLNESGMYALAFGSKLDGAKQFKKWVTSEVLPSIRKSGVYATDITVDRMISDPDFAIKLLTNLKEEKQKRLFMEKRLEEQAPKVIFADSVAGSNNSVLIKDLAGILKQNGIETGQNRLFEWLRNNGYLLSKGSYYNRPSQKSLEMGLFEMKAYTRQDPTKGSVEEFTTKVTGKGQLYFVNKFIKLN